MASKAKIDVARLKRQIANAASTLSVKAPALTTQIGKTYEVWVTMELAVALKGRHAHVLAKDHRGLPAHTFYVRGAPGHIRPKTSLAADEPCHIEVHMNSRAWEIHVSIEHVGASGEKHELDISVIPKDEAEAVRNLPNGGPFDGQRMMGLELKAYKPAATLDKSIPRTMVGIAVDLDPGVGFKIVPVRKNGGSGIVTWSHPPYWLLTTANVTQESIDYLKWFQMEAEGNVSPNRGHNKAAIATIAQHIAMRL